MGSMERRKGKDRRQQDKPWPYKWERRTMPERRALEVEETSMEEFQRYLQDLGADVLERAMRRR